MKLKPILLTLSFLTLSGCGSTTIQTLDRFYGDPEEGLAFIKDNPDVVETDKGFLLGFDALCSIYLDSNKFKDFFECIESYESKNFRYTYYRGGEFDDFTSFPALYYGVSRKYAKARLNRLKTEAYYRLGDYRNAIKYGEISLKEAKKLKGDWETLDTHINNHWKHPWAADVVSTAAMVAQSYIKRGDFKRARRNLEIAETVYIDAQGEETNVSFARVRRSHIYPLYLAFNQADRLMISEKTGWEWAQQAAGVGITGVAIAGGILGGGAGAGYLAGYGMALVDDANMTASDWLRERLQNARTFRVMNQKEKALDAYDEVLSDDLIHSMSELHWIALSERAALKRSLGDAKAAEKDLIKAVDLIELNRGNISTEAHKIGFAGSKEQVYQALVSVLVERKEFDLALEYVERSKARALVDMLADSENRGAQIDGFDGQMMLAMNSAASQVLSDALPMDESVRALKRARQNIKVKNPVMASLVTVESLDADALKALIPVDETLVEFYESEGRVLAFIVQNHRTQVVELKINLDRLQSDVGDFRKAIMDTSSDGYKTLSESLYQQLWSGLDSLIQNRKVTVIAHGVLHYLPVYALSSGDRYLIDDYQIRQLPSLQALKYIKPNTGNQTTLILGNPTEDLVGAETESRLLDRRLNAATYLRADARESLFKKNANGYGRIHIASHGEFDGENPMQSRLLLASDKQDDGSLTLSELYGIKLDADLVVMSACETALSDIANGDDLIGLNRGFLFAGARSIVSSLWLVDDRATQDMMLDFYANLEYTDKREALRRAQLNIKSSYSDHPYYWAAFQLTGRI